MGGSLNHAAGGEVDRLTDVAGGTTSRAHQVGLTFPLRSVADGQSRACMSGWR
jgi:hypothetical protein